MPKRTEVGRFLGQRKLRFHSSDGRHTNYSPTVGHETLDLPITVRLSKGRGEVTDREMGSLAGNLGVSEHNLREAISCQATRAVLFVCLATRLLRLASDDPITYPIERIGPVVDHLLDEALHERAVLEKATSVEARMVKDVLSTLATLQLVDGFVIRVQRIRRWAES